MQLKLRPQLHGDCMEPQYRDIYARDKYYTGDYCARSLIFTDERGTISDVVPLKIGVTVRPWYEYHPVHAVTISVQCRKCDNCRRRKRKQWLARARVELHNATRSWMLTLTLGFHARLEFGQDIKRFKREIRLMLVRMTKEGHRFRHIVCFERHKDDTLHAHLLIHDLHGFIPKRAIQRQWPHGFTNCKLADDSAPEYVAKYITKDMSLNGRIPVSKHYGQSTPLI